jgi:hypothetical protein
MPLSPRSQGQARSISLKIEEGLRLRIKMKKLKEKKLEGYPKVERKRHISVRQAKGLR